MESEAAAYIQATWQVAPRVLVICGSGMGPLAEALEDTVRISYKDIPHFPTTTIQGHQGELVMGYMNKIPTMCMLGRFHFYEGNEMERVVFPIRVARACGASFVVVTNAAGGLNPEYKVGDIMQITDHIALPCLVIPSDVGWTQPTSWTKPPQWPEIRSALQCVLS